MSHMFFSGAQHHEVQSTINPLELKRAQEIVLALLARLEINAHSADPSTHWDLAACQYHKQEKGQTLENYNERSAYLAKCTSPTTESRKDRMQNSSLE